MAIPLGRSLPSASCDRPERRREGSPDIFGSLRDACRSYLVLLPVGFSLPPPLPAARCALTAPFHPCRPSGVPRRVGGVLSVALSLGSPPPGVTRHRTSVEPGLSSPRATARSGHPTVWQRQIWGPVRSLSKPPQAEGCNCARGRQHNSRSAEPTPATEAAPQCVIIERPRQQPWRLGRLILGPLTAALADPRPELMAGNRRAKKSHRQSTDET